MNATTFWSRARTAALLVLVTAVVVLILGGCQGGDRARAPAVRRPVPARIRRRTGPPRRCRGRGRGRRTGPRRGRRCRRPVTVLPPVLPLSDTIDVTTPGREAGSVSAPEPEALGLVLVVEDDRAIADLVGLYLRRDGFGVHVESDGPGALDAVGRLRPVAVVLDIGLPGLDGVEVCRRMRAARRLDARAVRDRPRRRGRPDGRPRAGRRRLRHQAVQPARARGPGPCGAPPGRGLAAA